MSQLQNAMKDLNRAKKEGYLTWRDAREAYALGKINAKQLQSLVVDMPKSKQKRALKGIQ